MKNFTQSCVFILAIMFTTVFANQVSAQKTEIDNLVFGDVNKNIEVVSAPSVAFTTGNLVVCRVGTGVAALSSAATAVFLDEYTTAGALVQSIALPTADSGSNQTLTASGTATTECLLTRSVDGRYLIIPGYDAALGTASITTSTSAAINRVIGRVDSSGNIDTTTALTDAISGGNPRSATSTDGTNLYISGTSTQGGIRFTTLGSTTSVALSTSPTNLRATNIFGGQLYVSSGAGTIRLGTVGSGTPTTSGQTITGLPGLPTTGNFDQFYFADLDSGVAGLDTLYVADDAGFIRKYSLVAGTWVANGTLALSSVTGLTATVIGSNVTLFVTNPTSIQRVTDTSGYNATINGTFTNVATAASNTAFRGIALAPSITTAASATVGGRVTEANGRGIFRARVTLIDSQGVEQYAYTNPQGYYSFPDVPGGQTYIFSVRHLRYQFAAPSLVEFVDEDNPNINFVSAGESLRPANRVIDQ